MQPLHLDRTYMPESGRRVAENTMELVASMGLLAQVGVALLLVAVTHFGGVQGEYA